MSLPPFDLERLQSRYEHEVAINLAESGVEPVPLRALVDDVEAATALAIAASTADASGRGPRC